MTDSVTVDQTHLTVVRGVPTPQQLAALVAVVSTRRGAPTAAEPVATAASLWAARPTGLRRVLERGRGGWRASTLPR